MRARDLFYYGLCFLGVQQIAKGIGAILVGLPLTAQDFVPEEMKISAVGGIVLHVVMGFVWIGIAPGLTRLCFDRRPAVVEPDIADGQDP